MTPPAILPDLPAQAWLDAVKQAETPEEYKARIMLVRDMGLISDDEATDWIAMAGVQSA